MKTKRFLIAAAIACFCLVELMWSTPAESRFNTTAIQKNSMKERSETWLSSNVPDNSDASLRGNRIGNEDPTDDPLLGAPVGSSLSCLLVCAGIYAIVIARRKSLLPEVEGTDFYRKITRRR
jgi:hypothetical protein